MLVGVLENIIFNQDSPARHKVSAFRSSAFLPDGDNSLRIFRSWALLDEIVSNARRSAVRYVDGIAGRANGAVSDAVAGDFRVVGSGLDMVAMIVAAEFRIGDGKKP